MIKLKSFIIVAMMCLAGLTSYGQETLATQATSITKSLDDQVSLNQTQYDQVYQIQMDYLTAVSKLNTNNLADGRFYRERKALNTTRLSEINKVLTANQRAALIGSKKK